MARIWICCFFFLVLITLPVGAQAFGKQFESNLDTNDMPAAKKLVGKRPDMAMIYARGLGEKLAAGHEGKYLEYFKALVKIYKTVHKSDVVEHLGKFYLNGGHEASTEARKLLMEYSRYFSKFRSGEAQDKVAWKEAFAIYKDQADRCEQLGEMIYAAKCYHLLIVLLNKDPWGMSNEKLWPYLEKFVKCREAWDYKADMAWINNHKTYKGLKHRKDKGLPLDQKKSDNVEELGPALEYVKSAGWAKLPVKFKPWKDWQLGASQVTGTTPLLWKVAAISGYKGGGANMGFAQLHLHQPVVKVLRLKANEFGVDSNDDGKIDAPIKLGGKPKLVQFPLKLGGAKVKGGLFFWAGGSQENLSGYSMNLAPTHTYARIFYRGATAMEVKIKGKTYVIIDENATGRFGDYFNFKSPRHGDYDLQMPDAILHPKGSAPVPFSSLIRLDDGLYKLRVGGGTAELGKIDLTKTKMGSISLAFKGPKSAQPKSLIIGGEKNLAGICVDLARADKAVEMPVGTYRIMSGFIMSGKGARAKSAMIGQGNSEAIKIEEGQETVVQIGAFQQGELKGCYKFDFEYIKGSAIKINGPTVRVFGRGGEIYCDFWEATPRPFCFLQKGGKGKGKKMGQVAPPKDGADLDAYFRNMNATNNNFQIRDAIFAPMSLRIPKYPAGPIKIQLREKRHKFLGKIQSEWK